MGKDNQRLAAALTGLVNGFMVSQAIHVAATLGIADLLQDGPRGVDDLAAATDTPRAIALPAPAGARQRWGFAGGHEPPLRP